MLFVAPLVILAWAGRDREFKLGAVVVVVVQGRLLVAVRLVGV